MRPVLKPAVHAWEKLVMGRHGVDARLRLPALRTLLRGVRSSFLTACLCFPGAVMLVTTPLAAQAISGTVVEAETGIPIQGASVILLSRDGERLNWRLTDAAGRFEFRLPQPGTYLLQAERIGHARVLSEPIPIDRGVTVVYELEAPVQAIMLAGVEVESSRRCEVRPGQGAATATVWEEARKALEATSRTSGLGLYRYVIRRHERELDARGRRVRSEQSRLERQLVTIPFGSLNVDDLLDRGFVHDDDDGTIYYAPDADVLLSDPFLDTHCMSLAEGEDEAEGLIGLRFEPTQDRGVPDISGVLWVDPDDAKLQWLDYRYEFLDVPNSERLGGKIRFHGLPDGTWIVREWYIRMPLLQVRLGRGRARPRLVGLKEEGGLVVRVNNLQGDLVHEAPVDLIEELGLDAVAFLDDSAPVTTDDDGRARITSLMDGNYSSRLFAPAEECRLDDPPDEFGSPGILTGFVLYENGDPARAAVILVTWREVAEAAAGWTTIPKVLTASPPSGDGFFFVCGVPRDKPVDITVEWNGIESLPDRFRLSRTHRVSQRDIIIRGDR